MNTRFAPILRGIAVVLCPVLALPLPAEMQLAIVPPAESALKHAFWRPAPEIVFRVIDEGTGASVAGAKVTLQFPDPKTGASATLAGLGSFSQVADANGEVHLKGLRANRGEGTYRVVVTAEYGGASVASEIGMENIPLRGLRLSHPRETRSTSVKQTKRSRCPSRWKTEWVRRSREPRSHSASMLLKTESPRKPLRSPSRQPQLGRRMPA